MWRCAPVDVLAVLSAVQDRKKKTRFTQFTNRPKKSSPSPARWPGIAEQAFRLDKLDFALLFPRMVLNPASIGNLYQPFADKFATLLKMTG
jgi:hypothetical protein